MTITLNQEQQNIIDKFNIFLCDPTTKGIIIDGPGGTGKSLLLAEMVKAFKTDYSKWCRMFNIEESLREVKVTSATNKACEALSWYTNENVETIHHALGLQVKNVFSTGQEVLVPIKNFTIPENTLIFIDECSMLGKDLVQYLNSRTINCKFVFVGDRYQLPPVKLKESPVYSLGYPIETLTQPMRTMHQDLQYINTQLRRRVASEVIGDLEGNSPHITWLDENQALAFIKQHFSAPQDDTRILAYSNNQVNEYNQGINVLQGYPVDELLRVGQEIIFNEAFEFYTVVQKVSKDGTHAYNKRSLSLRVPTETSAVIQSIRDAASQLVFKIYDETAVPIQDVFNTPTGTTTAVTGYTTNITQQSEIIDNSQKQYKWVDIYITKGKHTGKSITVLYVDPQKRHKQMSEYFKKGMYQTRAMYKNLVADLRPGWAMTVHKAQGSTIPNVFIDLDDLGSCRNPDDFRKLLYVAFTRASEHVYLCGVLPPKYGDVLL